jgi:hypothetical protein
VRLIQHLPGHVLMRVENHFLAHAPEFQSNGNQLRIVQVINFGIEFPGLLKCPPGGFEHTGQSPL